MDHAINALKQHLDWPWNELVREWKSRNYLKLTDCPSYGDAKAIVDAIHILERQCYGEPKCITVKQHVEWTLDEDLIDGQRKAKAWLQKETTLLKGARITQYYDWSVIRWATKQGLIPEEEVNAGQIRLLVEEKPPEITDDGSGHTFFFIHPEGRTWSVTIPNIKLRREVSAKFEGVGDPH
jgi:hypothetical protein